MNDDEQSKFRTIAGVLHSHQSDASVDEHDASGNPREELVETMPHDCGDSGEELSAPTELREVERTEWTVLQKPIELVETCETGEGFQLIERKLFNLLLYYASECIKKEESNPGPFAFIARTKDLRDDLGMGTSTGNGRILEAMTNLSRQQLVFSPQPLRNEMEKGQGFLAWTFPTWLKLTPFEYKRYTKVDIEVSARFRSKYGLILYELTSMLIDRKKLWTEYPVDELRDWLGIGRADDCSAQTPGKLHGWNALQERALKPGLDEVNRHAPFSVKMHPRKDRRGRKIDKVRFVVQKKPGVK
jgi:hypothetical protein